MVTVQTPSTTAFDQAPHSGPISTAASASTAPTPVVSIQGAWASLAGNVVLEDINLDVRPGLMVGIIGPNGAGKTTLLRLVLGLLRPDRGRVLVFGQPPHRMGPAKHWVGYVPQRSDYNRWFPLSVLDVVLMGRTACRGPFRRFSKDDRDAAEQSLRQVDLWELRHRPIGELSGGQQQRVFLARGLCGHTRLLLLDEPHTGLDAPSQARFHDLLQHLQRTLGLTVIVVSHDLVVLSRYADELVCLNRTIHVQGAPADVLASSRLNDAYRYTVAPGVQHGVLAGQLSPLEGGGSTASAAPVARD